MADAQMGLFDRVMIGKPDSDHLSIHVDSRPSVDWLRTTVDVACGAWHGSFEAEYMESEFLALAKNLRRLYREQNGSVTFEAVEKTLNITFVADGKPTVSVHGIARADAAAGAYLRFEFQIDTTQIPGIIEALRHLEIP